MFFLFTNLCSQVLALGSGAGPFKLLYAFKLWYLSSKPSLLRATCVRGLLPLGVLFSLHSSRSKSSESTSHGFCFKLFVLSAQVLTVRSELFVLSAQVLTVCSELFVLSAQVLTVRSSTVKSDSASENSETSELSKTERTQGTEGSANVRA